MPEEAGSSPQETAPPVPEAASAPPPAAAAKRPPASPPKAPRIIPSQDDLARWVAGEDLPSLDSLFDTLNTKLFDTKLLLIKKDELLPQHWQVISRLTPPPDAEFDALAEVARLRTLYTDPAVAARRIEALRTAWQELRGKRPALWSASDLFAALRRIIDKKRPISFHDLLSAVRDVWRGLELPQGREQLEVLWACLDLLRSKAK
jgi:hypothetical protein